MNVDLLQGFYLGDLLVDPTTGKVTGRAGSSHLPSKAVEVLLRLAEEPGELVSRSKLLAAVWGEGRGSDEALGHAISEIRHALGDQHERPVFIQTLPKRGYRLLVAPEPLSQSSSTIVMGAVGGARAADIGFIDNLRQRGVIETGVAYLILGWLLIQIADIVFDQLHFEPWAGTFVTLLIICGFPIALALSWFLEIRGGNAVLDRTSAVNARRRRFSRTYMSIVGALAIAAVGVFIYDRTAGLPAAPERTVADEMPPVVLPPIEDNTLAVLPFLNLDGSDETAVFANGLVDDVLTSLARVPGLLVASRGDSYSLAPNTPSQTVRERLRVAHYLEGSVQIADDRIRVIVQLIDSETGFHVMSRSFDRPREDFFDIRDEVTSLTVANMRPALPPKTRVASVQAVDDPALDAYVLYRRGIDASRKPTTPETIAESLDWFDKALAIDPDYAAAHAGKCNTYALGYPITNDAEFIARAESSCTRALALNPNLDIVHTSLGLLYTSTGRYDAAIEAFLSALDTDPSNVDALLGLGDAYRLKGNMEEAEAVLRRAIGLHPGNRSAYIRLGNFEFHGGRYEESAEHYRAAVSLEANDMTAFNNLGIAHMLSGDFEAARWAFSRAIEIEPKKSSLTNLGLMYYYLGDYVRAIEAMTRAVELQPNDHLAHANLGDVLWAAGHAADSKASFSRARTLGEKALAVNPSDPYTLMDLAWIYAMLNDGDKARETIDRVLDLIPNDAYSHYYDALIALQAGDEQHALAALHRAADAGYSRVLIQAEPHLAALRNNPEFLAIVSQP